MTAMHILLTSTVKTTTLSKALAYQGIAQCTIWTFSPGWNTVKATHSLAWFSKCSKLSTAEDKGYSNGGNSSQREWGVLQIGKVVK